ncbi:helix-turn-helix domain-containing protein [Micromonospora sp. MED01]|uniref:helix-turn-helix transcriptional regulator n=1 Tax=Micromonospora alfalfae TaxID=2911212 RepID=UPI001EE94F5B|nr:helix-turn-helix transcriptional regulator [Micromonospora alfalfae]MCG5464185.1 helix-turn-helix domain-containing protein [Micromonospora alfalfae]
MLTPTDLHPDDRAARINLRNLLVNIRRDADISQARLGARIGASQTVIAGFERGEPSRISVARRIAAGLGHRLLLLPADVPGGPYDDPTETLFRPADPEAALVWDQRQLMANLVAARQACGFRQADVAAALGKTENVISEFERSKGIPLFGTCQRYCRTLGGHLWLGVESGWDSRGARFHPNEVLPCGTASARRRHVALGQECRVCESTAPAASRINEPTISRQEAAA